MSKLQKAYDAFVQKCGPELAATILNANGATNGLPGDVPSHRADSCANALNKIMGGGAITLAQINNAVAAADKPEDADPFAAIRSKAFRKIADDDADEAPKQVAEIDPVRIYANWNRARRKRDED